MNYLFVYGTLMTRYNNPYAVNLRKWAKYVSKGKIKGILYHCDHYPGLIQSEWDDRWVEGEIHQLPDNPTLLKMLDEYEGYTEAFPSLCEFIRQKVPVLVPDNSWLDCWVYLYNGSVEGLSPIEKW
jgi:gamma-glutamylcyclotransferase (GGCT)/AIG2-like uncharacterized protein YtfP